jgi:adenosylcobinamide-GDP ribazoletransferase
MGFFTALKFLTIFPGPARYDEGPEQLGRAIAFFPIIGLIIGIVLGGMTFILRTSFSTMVNAALLVTALVILTGAHHLDGLMDTCDGMVVGRTKIQRLEIMSDTRTGAFGIAGACLILLLKYAIFCTTTGMAAMLIFPAASRWAMSGTILIFPSARESGSGYAARQGANWGGFIIGSLIMLILCFLCLGLVQRILLMAGVIALVCALGAILTIIYGGLTGDSYGAIVEISEVLALLLIKLINSHWSAFPGNALIVFP